jgi:hypothetical protein
MRVFSTFIAWSNENKSCMRVDKREFTWEFSQLSLIDQTRTRVAWRLRSESLHESFLNFHCLIKREQELHESLTWEFSQLSLLDQTRTRVAWEFDMRVFSTFIAWSNENKSCMRVDNREFTWEFSQLSLLDQSWWESMRVSGQTRARFATLSFIWLGRKTISSFLFTFFVYFFLHLMNLICNM